jgi:hypothetical protein
LGARSWKLELLDAGSQAGAWEPVKAGRKIKFAVISGQEKKKKDNSRFHRGGGNEACFY